MPIDEILIIKHDDISYGIPTRNIEQIQHIPELTPLALSPEEIKGLSAVGGNIRTVMDTNLLLGMDAVDIQKPLSRLLMLTAPYVHIALLISEVVESILIDEQMIEYVDASEDAVVAIYKHDETIVQILDLERLFKDVLLKAYAVKEVKEKNRGLDEHFMKSEGSSERYLLFKMENERYALKIDFLREIISMPERFTDLAGSSNEIEGMIQLRDELLVVADLRRYYGFEQHLSEKNSILVAQYEGKNIGLIVDEIIDIRDFTPSQIEDLPENFKDKKLSGVIHSKEQLVSLIGESILAGMIHANEKLIVSADHDEQSDLSSVALEVVAFKLGQEEYAINIEDVASIIDTVPVTPIPDAPELIEGIINIRGQVVPIGSLYKRLGIPVNKQVDRKVIVCQIGKEQMGFMVDSVTDVMNIYQHEIRPEDERSELFTDVLHLNDGERLVLMFNLQKLFNGEAV